MNRQQILAEHPDAYPVWATVIHDEQDPLLPECPDRRLVGVVIEWDYEDEEGNAMESGIVENRLVKVWNDHVGHRLEDVLAGGASWSWVSEMQLAATR